MRGEKHGDCSGKFREKLNIILGNNNSLYFVNGVNAEVNENADKIKAIFHAKRASDDTPQDLDIELNQCTYDVLSEYAKMAKVDLIMALQIEGASGKMVPHDRRLAEKSTCRNRKRHLHVQFDLIQRQLKKTTNFKKYQTA